MRPFVASPKPLQERNSTTRDNAEANQDLVMKFSKRASDSFMISNNGLLRVNNQRFGPKDQGTSLLPHALRGGGHISGRWYIPGGVDFGPHLVDGQWTLDSLARNLR